MVSPLFAYAYDDNTTHPALTQEIVKLFNQSFPDKKLNDEEKELLIRGSINEDQDSRWMQHFYDPVYNRGLVLGKEWMSSKLWAQNTKAQAGLMDSALAGTLQPFFSGKKDYSWDRAIYEYVWGDKKRGLEALGHVLHLLEDATVPDHTRNDPHPSVLDLGSPYEAWTKRFTKDGIHISVNGKSPILLNDINLYFDLLATNSNNNFFSKDTILYKTYPEPKVATYKTEKLSNGLSYTFGYSTNNYRLFRIDRNLDWRSALDKNQQDKLYLQDNDNLILTDYWTRLSEQAVLHGAGAIKLFFDEVEKEKQTKVLYEKNRSWLDKQKDTFASTVFNISRALYGSSVTEKDLEDLSNEGASIALAITPQAEPKETSIPVSPAEEESAPEPRPSTETQNIQPPTPPREIGNPSTSSGNILRPTPVILPPASSNTGNAPFAPGAGAGAAPPPPPPAETTTATPTPPPSDTTPPAAPVISSPQENFVASTTSLTFSGTAEASSTITNNLATSTATTTDASGNWSLIIDSLPQGTTTIQFFAKDAAGNISSSTSRAFFIDSTAPDLTFTIAECTASLSPDACLVATTTVTLAWSSSATDLSFFELTVNGAVSTTTATSTILSLGDVSTNTISIRAADQNNNTSTAQSKTVEVAVRPVVINEVAWMGTSAARSQDEWIELLNTTSRAIDLSGWVLRSKTDNSPYITLSGTIPAKGFFVLERTDDTTISDLAANQIYTGALSNSGEALELSRASTTIDATPDTNSCNGWCAGNDTWYYTMERYNPLESGTTSANWLNALTLLRNGKNADGAAITGTPGARNTAHYLIHRSNLFSSKTLTKSLNPYVVAGTFEVAVGVTLTLEPGVIIKFSGANTSLLVNGTLDARGTTTEPVVFTSFQDDDCGIAGGCGDTNGTTTPPTPGDWNTIRIQTGGQAILDRAIIRYGGNTANYSGEQTELLINQASTSVTNSIIEKSGGFGIWMKESSGTIEGNTIRDNTVNTSSASTGFFLYQSSPVIRQNTFSGNTYGLLVSGTTSMPQISQNTFINNTRDPITIISAYPTFSDNTASGNGKNGIFMQNALVRDYTLEADLPYIFTNQNVAVLAGKTLTINPGVVIKMQGFSPLIVVGKLIAHGTAEKKIVFTSLNDDDCGLANGCGDTNGTTTSPTPGDWESIEFRLGSASSTLEHVIIRYGGGTGSPAGAVRILDTSIDIKNALVEKNYYTGIWMQNSTSTLLTNSVIQNHQDTTSTQMSGLFLLSGSSPTISNTVFQNNEVNIGKDGLSSFIDAGGNTPNPLQ